MTYYHDYWVCNRCDKGTYVVADVDWTHEGYDDDYCPECSEKIEKEEKEHKEWEENAIKKLKAKGYKESQKP